MPFPSEARSPGAARPLSVAEQQALLQYARDAITEAVCRGDLPRALRHDGIFAERCGVFVTLHVHQRLRGCIGVVETPPFSVPLLPTSNLEPQNSAVRVPHPRSERVGPIPLSEYSEPTAKPGDDMEPPNTIDPLGSTVVRCAPSAALGDPRFPPIRPDELPDLRIEISLLSTPTPIRPEQIEIGRHGLLVVSDPAHYFGGNPSSNLRPPSSNVRSSGGSSPKRGLLLPQVAVEHHLTAEQFLAETCRKAGLPPDAWRQPNTLLFGFTCQVFAEPPVRGGSPSLQ